MIYLAAPYSHPDAEIRAMRVAQASHTAARLMQAGHTVYSPLSHGAAIATYLPIGQDMDHAFWMAQCLPLLHRASRLVVLRLHDWELSQGVRMEIDEAKFMGLTIHFIDYGREITL